MATIQRTIKYDADRDKAFCSEIMTIPGCEKLQSCVQCGTCSGVCPLSIYMDYAPRRIINLTRSGFKDEVLRSNTIWLCASCYSCTVDCPKGIKITDIMYALKQRAISEGVYPKRFPIPVLAREFFKMVRSKGRTSENFLATTLLLKTNILGMFGMWRLGLNLVRTGRFIYWPERMKDTSQLRRILEAAPTEQVKREERVA